MVVDNPFSHSRRNRMELHESSISKQKHSKRTYEGYVGVLLSYKNPRFPGKNSGLERNSRGVDIQDPRTCMRLRQEEYDKHPIKDVDTLIQVQ